MDFYFFGRKSREACAMRSGKFRPRLEPLEDRLLLDINPIVEENKLPGAPQSQWDIINAGDPSIQGYATDISVNHGETINFKINTPSLHYRLDVYRMGYYGGMGARQVATIDVSLPQAQVQPGPVIDPATGLMDYGTWSVSASWAVPVTAVSGIYFAKLVREDGVDGTSHVFFVVRDDGGKSDLLYQTSDATWQAYNQYGGNSLYVGNEPVGRAYKVSYNRPFDDRSRPNGFGSYNWVFDAEYPMVRWLEANGYYVSYFTDVDSDRRGSQLLKHKVFLSSGHDEYWSGGQRGNVEAARDAGVNLAFFSGNESFWKTRWETSIDGSGTPYRTLVCYKESTANDKIDPLKDTWTGNWRDPRFSPPADGGRPENALSGNLYVVNGDDSRPITVPDTYANLRFWRNTAVAALLPGQTATLANDTLGYEWDEDVDNGARPAGLFDLSSTTAFVDRLWKYGDTYLSGKATHSLTMYRAASGARVFATGTIRWSWGLDGHHDGPPSTPDLSMQQATVNLFADMGVQPGSIQPGLIAATASTDASAPTSTITTPLPGAFLGSGTSVTITGTATDTGGGVVAGVEISTDGGVTWHPALGRSSWTYAWTPNGTGLTTIRSRAVDDSGNLEIPGPGITVTLNGPLSLWGNQPVPAVLGVADPNSIELGMKFRSDVAGLVSGVRFYKGPNNTGTHLANLWSSTGTLLATATFSSESTSGWQQVTFATPIAINANTTYVVSYHTNAGTYSVDSGFFTNGVTNGPLHALKDGAEGANGVFAYGSSSTFPTQGKQASNFWVDVVFTPNDAVVPAVASMVPAPGAVNVALTTPVQAVFNKAVVASSIAFTLKDPAGNLIAATVAYDDPSHTATLTPSAALAPNVTFTATISGVKDALGNVMASPVSWSFTTVAFSGTGPFTIWPATAVPASPADLDGNAVELGVKFRAEVSGFLTGIRFFKSVENVGTHVGSLWSSNGTLLAQAIFTTETTSGWQQVNFSTPVAISANTTYVASYHTNVGHYAADNDYFISAGVDNPPLHALKDGTDGGNSVYNYSISSTFPNQTWKATNYWVDVVFTTASVTLTAPAPGAVLKGTVTLAADAVSPLGIASVQFQLDGVNLGAALTTTPYALAWDTTKVTDGNHALRAIATDTKGNTLASTSVSVQVNNAPAPANLIVDGSKTFQKIDGFGANLNATAWNDGKVTSALDTLLTVQGDNLFRVIIETVSGWEDTFNPDPYIFNSVYATPKFTNLWNEISYLNSKNVPVMLNVMGYLPAWFGPNDTIALENEDAWADMIASMVYYGINTAKVKIDYLSPLNEEDVGNPEGPSVGEFQYVELMDKLLAKLAAHGLGNIPLVGPDVANVDNLTNYYLPQVFGDPKLTSTLKHVTFHDYFGKSGSVDAAIQNSGVKGLDWWVTEYAGGLYFDADQGVPIPDEWDFSEKSFQYLVQHLQAGASGATVYDGVDAFYQHHGAINSWGQMAWNPKTEDYTPRKRLYANAQVFQFVKPGEVRVASSTTLPGLVQIAFADPAAGRVTITGENTGDTEVTLTGSLTGGLSATSFQAYFTNSSAGMDLKKQPNVVVTGGTFTLTVPAHTIFTLYSSLSGSGGGDSGEVATSLIRETPRPSALAIASSGSSFGASDGPDAQPINRPWELALALNFLPSPAPSFSNDWRNPSAQGAVFRGGLDAGMVKGRLQEGDLALVGLSIETPASSIIPLGIDPFFDLFGDARLNRDEWDWI
jgi:hypothetical protein